MNKIKLPNREIDNLYLVPEEDYYVLDGPDVYRSYLRIIFDGVDPENGQIVAIDPPGGPYMTVGYVLGDKKISRLTFKNGEGTKIYLEDNETN